MSENDGRYGSNRNTWRKVYGYGRRKPNVVTYYDSKAEDYVTRDLNKTFKHRDYFNVDKETVQQPITEYEEGLIYFDNQESSYVDFSIEFSGLPTVTLTFEETGSMSGSNISLYGVGQPTVNRVYAGTSVAFSGSVRYRAIYSNRPFPQQLTDQVYTSSFWIYAKKLLVANATQYTASYSDFPAGTPEFRQIAFDVYGSNSTNVRFTNDVLSLSESRNSLSAPLTNQIHFMVTVV